MRDKWMNGLSSGKRVYGKVNFKGWILGAKSLFLVEDTSKLLCIGIICAGNWGVPNPIKWTKNKKNSELLARKRSEMASPKKTALHGGRKALDGRLEVVTRLVGGLRLPETSTFVKSLLAPSG